MIYTSSHLSRIQESRCSLKKKNIKRKEKSETKQCEIRKRNKREEREGKG